MKNVYQKLIEAITDSEAIKATAYLSDGLVIKATKRIYKHRQPTKQTEILVTIGRPNCQERGFIKTCKRAGETFPVKKIQLKFKSR